MRAPCFSFVGTGLVRDCECGWLLCFMNDDNISILYYSHKRLTYFVDISLISINFIKIHAGLRLHLEIFVHYSIYSSKVFSGWSFANLPSLLHDGVKFISFFFLSFGEHQVVRLLRAIYRPHNLYCVHVDRKSNEALQASLRMVIACLPNVLLVPRAINVTWGSVTTLEPVRGWFRVQS